MSQFQLGTHIDVFYTISEFFTLTKDFALILLLTFSRLFGVAYKISDSTFLNIIVKHIRISKNVNSKQFRKAYLIFFR